MSYFWELIKVIPLEYEIQEENEILICNLFLLAILATSVDARMLKNTKSACKGLKIKFNVDSDCCQNEYILYGATSVDARMLKNTAPKCFGIKEECQVDSDCCRKQCKQSGRSKVCS
ncbi:hypothetical protein ABPG74_004847 [Tetrahymena malaccensis]